MRQTARMISKTARRGWLARARVALASGVLGCAAVASLALPLGSGPLTGNVALACGLGAGPTMLANNLPAAAIPASGSATSPVPGIFETDYATTTPINFGEDLSRVPSLPDASGLKWKWTFGDGASTTTSATPAHTYKKPGTYNIFSYFYSPQDKQWVQLDGSQIHVVASLPPDPPTARITESTRMAMFGQSITFDASGSTSTDNSKLSYAWNFSDGQTATGVKVTHQFGAVFGQGFITLTVTDGRGAKSVATANVVVPHYELAATAQSIVPGKSVSFSLPANATSSSDGQATSYTWHFDDGTPDETTSQPSITHTFARSGRYAVTLQYPVPSAIELEGIWIAVALPPPPPWRYYIGGGAVALGILISLLAAVRSQQRQIKLAEERKAAREMARARRVGSSDRAYSGRGGYADYDDYDDYAPRGGRGDAYPPGRSGRSRSPGGSSGRGERQNRQRQGPPRGRSRDDGW